LIDPVSTLTRFSFFARTGIFQPGNFIGRTGLIEIEKEERPWPIA
jgi:hypothetical protein